MSFLVFLIRECERTAEIYKEWNKFSLAIYKPKKITGISCFLSQVFEDHLCIVISNFDFILIVVIDENAMTYLSL